MSFRLASAIIDEQEALLDRIEHPVRTMIIDVVLWSVRQFLTGALFAAGALTVAAVAGVTH